MDRERVFQFANDTAEKVFPELSGDNPDEVTAFIERELIRDIITQNERVYEIHMDEQKDVAGKRSGYLMMIHDVTERELAKRAEEKRIASEMNLAKSIQVGVLPRSFPAFPDRQEFDIFASMDPAKEVGGDFYDFFMIDDDHLAMVIADVSGKGIPAALFMMVAKALIQNQLMSCNDPAKALESVNRQLCENNNAFMFVTVWAAVLELSTGKGLAVNAGHENPAIYREGGCFELLTYKHNKFLGVIKGAKYENRPFEMKPGDCLLVYTDGVPEANDKDGKMFGEERLKATLNSDPGADAEKLIKMVRSAVNEFVQDAPQFDDITMLSLKYYGAGTTGDVSPQEGKAYA